MSKLVDIHAHIQFNAYKDDADEVIKRAVDEGVFMIAPSSQNSTSQRAVEYANKYAGKVWAGVGLHPIHLKSAHFDPSEGEAPAFSTRVEEFDPAFYKSLAEKPEVVAIGETGLDFAERLNVSEDDRDKQEEVFRKQIELALEVKKPIIQHCRQGVVSGKPRDAHEDALRIIAEYAGQGLSGTAHCYSGTLEQARRYVDLGFSISFTGLITFVNLWDNAIREIQLDRIMPETDCPYMTPVPHRGERNEPRYVQYVVRRIAELKGISFEEAAEATFNNANKLFGLGILEGVRDAESKQFRG